MADIIQELIQLEVSKFQDDLRGYITHQDTHDRIDKLKGVIENFTHNWSTDEV